MRVAIKPDQVVRPESTVVSICLRHVVWLNLVAIGWTDRTGRDGWTDGTDGTGYDEIICLRPCNQLPTRGRAGGGGAGTATPPASNEAQQRMFRTPGQGPPAAAAGPARAGAGRPPGAGAAGQGAWAESGSEKDWGRAGLELFCPPRQRWARAARGTTPPWRHGPHSVCATRLSVVQSSSEGGLSTTPVWTASSDPTPRTVGSPSVAEAGASSQSSHVPAQQPQYMRVPL